MTHLDTSALIEAIVAPGPLFVVLEHLVRSGEPVGLSAVVLFEWRRGRRTPAQLAVQERLFPAGSIVNFGEREAAEAAHLYRTMRRPRGREVDLMIAATAIVNGARLWTLNTRDFSNVPGLKLYS
jgi:tRNA(fMet)-specific endonuclease VapC